MVKNWESYCSRIFYFALVFTCMCEVFVLSAGKLYRLWGYSGSPVWCSDRSHHEEEAGTVSPRGRGTGPQNQHAEGAGLPVYSTAAAHDRTAALLYWGPERKRPCLISSGLYEICEYKICYIQNNNKNPVSF